MLTPISNKSKAIEQCSAAYVKVGQNPLSEIIYL